MARKNKSKSAKNNVRPKIRPTSQIRQVASFTQRTADYAATLADPWNNTGARIPVPPMVPSATVAAMARITMTTSSATGRGYVLVNPFRMVANNAGAILISDAAYSGAYGFDITTAPTPSTSYSNSPYALADFAGTVNGGLKYRLVSAAVRCVYTGSELNRGGSFMAICDPAGGDLSGAPATRIGTIPHVVDRRITEKYMSVNWCPCDPDDFEYKGSPAADGQLCLGILLYSAANTQPFTVEIISNFEVVGAKAPGATIIRPDTDGALSVVGSAAQLHVGGQQAAAMPVKTILQRAGDAIVDTTKSVATSVLSQLGGGAAVSNMAANYIVDRFTGGFSDGGRARIEL